jgi:RNA polymerase sigma-70 factor (ECF subfamily)
MPNAENLTDEQLAVIVRTQNKELYSELIERYSMKLGHYLRKFIHSADELEDVLQNVFIKAYRNLNAFDADKRFSPWIYRIAHNEALNFLKKYRRESVRIDETEMEIIDHDADVKSEVDAILDREKIERAFSLLKFKYREPLVLFFFENKTYEEIGDILHLPKSTVGTLIKRGKEKLKELLHQYGQKQ